MERAKLIVFLLLIAAAGCDSITEIATDEISDWFFNDEEDCECNNSYLHNPSEGMPKEGEVVIRVNNKKGDVKILVYNGSIEGKVVSETMSEGERNTITLPVNRQYTYVAEYVKDSDTILVPVNSRFECKKKECKGRECYFFYNNIVDLSLRY